MKHGENAVTAGFHIPKKTKKASVATAEESTLEQIRRIMDIPSTSSPGSILRLLRMYRESYEAGAVDDGIREYVNTGGEAAFYGIGLSNV